MKIATAAAMKAMDAYAIHTLGVPSTDLMEHAAQAVAEQVMTVLGGRPGTVCIFCGSGNNGGDGVAAARFLRRRGCFVYCWLVGRREKLSADTAEMERRLVAEGGALLDYDAEEATEILHRSGAAVDAMFGTGLSRDLAGNGLDAAEMLNASCVPVVACDVPSGIDTDTGRVLGTAVRAAVTVTFSCPKPGLLLPPGQEYAGQVVVADIGIPKAAQDSQPGVGTYVTADFVRAQLPKRLRGAHKGDFGKVLLLCGSRGYTGAAAMAARAALRAGAGLISLGVPESVYSILASKLDEVMVFPLPEDESGRLSSLALPEILWRLKSCDAALMGPGLGRSDEITEIVQAVITSAGIPLVVDADGINALEGHMDVLRGTAGPVVLTPHDGEFVRLGGDAADSDRMAATIALARETGAVVVRKGYRTVTAAGEQCYVNSTGNPGMATGGSGDVLSGIILAFLGQGLTPAEAAASAVYVHGAAGDACAARLGEYGMTPSDLILAVPPIIK